MINRFIGGFKAFRARYFEQRPELFETLVSAGQKPKVLVVACSDSRVDPAILFGAEPGELFVIRNVANLIPPYEPDGRRHGTSAALEYAVRDLEVEHIVVLGHSCCGGIAALQESLREPLSHREFIAPWVGVATGHDDGHRHEDDIRDLERGAVRVSLANLRTFPWVVEREAQGLLAVHGWWFDMESGTLWGLDESDGTFKVLTAGG